MLTTAEELTDWYTQRRAVRQRWTPEQLQAFDSLWNALRNGDIDRDAADIIETMIHRRRIAGARKRLTQARARHRTPMPATTSPNNDNTSP